MCFFLFCYSFKKSSNLRPFVRVTQARCAESSRRYKRHRACTLTKDAILYDLIELFVGIAAVVVMLLLLLRCGFDIQQFAFCSRVSSFKPKERSKRDAVD